MRQHRTSRMRPDCPANPTTPTQRTTSLPYAPERTYRTPSLWRTRPNPERLDSTHNPRRGSAKSARHRPPRFPRRGPRRWSASLAWSGCDVAHQQRLQKGIPAGTQPQRKQASTRRRAQRYPLQLKEVGYTHQPSSIYQCESAPFLFLCGVTDKMQIGSSDGKNGCNPFLIHRSSCPGPRTT